MRLGQALAQNTALGAQAQGGMNILASGGGGGGRNFLGVPYGSDNYASQTNAAISDYEWKDYVKRFGPIEEQLLSMYDSAENRQRAVDFAGRTIEGEFERIPEQQDRYLRGLGVTQTKDQKAARSKNLALQKSLADVGAKNYALQAVMDRDDAIVAGTAQGRQHL